MSPNLEFATVFVGVISILFFQQSFWAAVAAIVLGTALGSLTHGVLSARGPEFGVPQMVLSRIAFGRWGNALPAGLNAVVAGIGWFAVNSVSGALALTTLTGMSSALSLVIVVAAQVLIAFMGHNLVHTFERYAFPLLAVAFLLASVLTLAKARPGAAAGGGGLGGFLLTVGAAFGYAAGWNPYATDYTRYLPPNTDRRMVGLWAGLGVFISCVVLEMAGAVLVTVAGTKWGPDDIPTQQLQHAMPGLIYYLSLLSIAVGAVAANAINIYSGTMSLVALGIREMGLTLRQRRAVIAIIAGVIGYFGGLYLESQGYQGKYEFFLLLISYWIAPWLAVVLIDYWLHKGDYGDESIFYDTKYQRWQGAAAMAIGLVVSVWLFSNNALYLGVVPKANPEFGDLTFIVGFILTGILYYAFNMVGRRATSPAGMAGSRA